ncbi:MAG: hypothetical protein Q8L35_07110 [Actinomycetota bacterium]|nr:hypothetical protein [Actinomycetota bacterium]
MRRFRVLILVLAALFVLGLATGCDSTRVKTATRKPKEAIPVIKAEVTPVPADWPKEIPTYPSAELVETSITPTGKILTYKTKDPAYKIFEWYYDTLEAAKWTMKGPTLDVAQNLAIIKSELGSLSFLLDTRLRKNDKGESEGSTITLITPAPKLGGP